jgi:hypothetical protein
MQLQLKHLPLVFLAVAALCLTGAFAASADAPDADIQAVPGPDGTVG